MPPSRKAAGRAGAAKGALGKSAPGKGAPSKAAPSKAARSKAATPRSKAATPAGAERRYWLIKSEPDVFSFDDLLRAPGRTTHWDGVRNYQARNFMRDGMRVGDLVFYYHSNTAPMAIAGVAEVVREAYPDHTAFDAADPHYDAGSRPDAPTWLMVDVRAVERFDAPITLEELRATPGLEGLELLRRGSRLSVQPVSAAHWEIIRGLRPH